MGFQRYQAIDLTTNSLSGICKRNRFLTENKVLKYQFFHINPTINGNGLEIAGEKQFLIGSREIRHVAKCIGSCRHRTWSATG